MTEPAPAPAPEQPAAQPEPPSWDELFKGEDPAKVKEALENSRKWEQRSKENHAAAKDAERQRLAAMNESDRALSEAESKGRTAATQEYGQRLVRAEFESAAARRNPDANISRMLGLLNLATFVGDDGEPDVKAIKGAVEEFVQPPANAPTQFDGGARTNPAPTQGMNDFIRQAAGRA